MLANLSSSLTFAAAISAGLMAGVFFTFSVFVMQALGQLPAAQAIAAMQSINITIVRSLFMLVFLGTAVCSIALVIYSGMHWSEDQLTYTGIGAAIYLAGVFIVTICLNVPLNDALAELEVADSLSDTAWAEYYKPWMAWNHVRTVAAVASSIAFTTSLVVN